MKKGLGTSFARFISNKNTVTILGVLIGIIVLYVGYNYRVNKSVEKVKVPCAAAELTSRQIITSDNVSSCEIPRSLVSKFTNIITQSNQVINKYVSYGTTIPENSFFYSTAIMTSDEMPDSAFNDIPDGNTIFSLSVNLSSTYGNSIYPGNYIDLFLKAQTPEGLLIYDKFIESIEVLAVKDSQGRHVFETTVEDRTPAELLFSVPDELYLLLSKARFLSGVTITPVPRNAEYSKDPSETKISSEYIRDFVMAKTQPTDQSYVNPITE